MSRTPPANEGPPTSCQIPKAQGQGRWSDIGADAWQRVSDVLNEALEAPPSARSELLTLRCAGDHGLRREVEALLAIDTRTLDAEDRPVFTFFGMSPASDLSSVGPYELMAEIGRGGMASVHLARDPSQRPSVPVAVKLLKRGMDSDEIVRHFRREGEMLGRLRHPCIASLHGGGTTDQHRPYLVMEYVDGEPIDVFCDRRQLGLEERLGLFLKVCDAVHHAHRNLVLHRDLKPSNILVTKDGIPKLLDFGIAKWLDPETSQPMTLTADGLRAMTPEYAAPEQIVGKPVTIACDIYSLGVVLYRLLTGRLPFEPTTGRSLLQQVLEDEPPRPSSAVAGPDLGLAGPETQAASATGLTEGAWALGLACDSKPDPVRRRQLKGDLDNVLAKTLRKEPELRYASVEHLAEDLKNYLARRPVAARGGSWSYRWNKAIQRNRGVSVLALLLLLTLVAALVGRENQQRQVRLERDRALAGQDFLVQLFAEADPYQGKDGRLEVGEILERGVESIDRLADQPELQGPLLTVLGEIYLNLGRFPEAESLMWRSLNAQQALESPDPLELAKAGNILGQLLAEQGDTGGAEQYLRAAMDDFRRLNQPEQLAGALATLAMNKRNQGRYDEAEAAGAESLRLMEELGLKHNRTYLVGLNNMGFIAYGQGDLKAAQAYFDRSLALTRDLVGENHPDMAMAYNNLASLAIAEDRLDVALAQLEEALDIWRRFLDPRHPNLFTAQVNIAALLHKDGRSQETVSRLQALMPEVEAALGSDHGLWSSGMLWWIRALAAVGRPEESVDLGQRVLGITIEAHGETHPLTAQLLYTVALSLEPLDREGAIALLRRCLRVELQNLGPDHPDVAETEKLLASWTEAS